MVAQRKIRQWHDFLYSQIHNTAARVIYHSSNHSFTVRESYLNVLTILKEIQQDFKNSEHIPVDLKLKPNLEHLAEERNSNENRHFDVWDIENPIQYSGLLSSR